MDEGALLLGFFDDVVCLDSRKDLFVCMDGRYVPELMDGWMDGWMDRNVYRKIG